MKFAWGLVLSLVAVPLLAQSMTEAAAKEKQRRDAVHGAEWQEFKNPAGDFKVLFPYSPLKKRELIPGMATLMDTYVAAKDKRSYVVRVGEIEAELLKRPVEQTQDEIRAGILKDSEGTLEDEKKISLGSRAGRQYKVRMKNKAGDEIVIVARSFVTDTRVVLVMAGALADDKDSAIAERFFSSFALLR